MVGVMCVGVFGLSQTPLIRVGHAWLVLVNIFCSLIKVDEVPRAGTVAPTIKRQNVFKYPLVRNKLTDIATGRGEFVSGTHWVEPALDQVTYTSGW